MLESSETGEQGQLGTICVPVSDSLHQRRTLPFTISTSPFSITVTPQSKGSLCTCWGETIQRKHRAGPCTQENG